MTKTFKKTLLNRDGAALVEYGILVGLVSVLAISAVLALGIEVKDTFTNVSDALDESMTEIADTGPTADPSTPAPSTGNPAWTVLDDYPTGAACTDVDASGNYDPSYSCFNIDAQHEVINDFSTVPGALTFRINGTGTSGPDAGAVQVGNGGSSSIITTTANTRYFHWTGPGNDYVLFPSRSCSDMSVIDANFGVLRLDFGDGMTVVSYDDLEGVYCAGDDTTYDNADLMAISTSESGGGMGGF